MNQFKWAAALLLAFLTAANAQVTGSLSGVVTDPADAAVVNASVRIFSAGGSDALITVQTTSSGRFLFPALNPDTYDISIQSSGFAPVTYRQIVVSPRLETSLPTIKLQLQSVAQTVEVIAEAQSLPTQDIQLSTTLTVNQIQNLPVLGRQITNLFSTQPGISSNSGLSTSVNGMRSSFANVTLDGVNVQDNFIRTNDLDYAPYRTTIDQVEEVTFVTANPSAAYGGGAAQVAMVTRSGTNQFHGTAYWYNRNNALSANDWFNNRDGVAQPKLNLNQPGFSLGGPVPLTPKKLLKDKLFFFTTYEWYRNKRQSSQIRTVLTDSAKQGIFTYNAGGVRRTADLRALRGYTPDPTVAALLAQLPTPNSTGGDGLNTSGYRFNAASNEFRDQFVYKSDYYINSNHSITGSINWIDNPTQRPDVTSSFFTTQPTVGNTVRNNLMSIRWRGVFSPTLTNELQVGFARNKGNFDVNTPYSKLIVAGLLFSNPSNTFLAQGRQTNTYPIQDNATWIHNNHQVSFGYQYQRINTTPFNDAGIVPTYTLGISTANTTGLTTADLPGIGTTDLARANSLYANLAGIISSSSQTFNVTSPTSGFVPGATSLRRLNVGTHSLYVQDNWKIARRLTLNLGVRYEYWSPLDEQDGLYLAPRIQNNDLRASLLDPNATLDFIGGNSGRKFYKADKNNFAPVLGLAWSISDKTVLRGGYSLSFVNDSVITTVRNNVNTANGLQFANTQTNLTANLTNAPAVPAPTYKVPRTLADPPDLLDPPVWRAEQAAHLRPAFAVTSELPLRPLEEHLKFPFATLELVDLDRLSRVLEQLRFRVPRIDVRHAAAHV